MSQPEVKLFNTLGRQVEPFAPIIPGEVKIYSCGPTVYNYVHIGNLRAFVFADIVRRTFKAAGYNVTHVRNITDVGHLTDDGDNGDDKMAVAMQRERKSAREIADYYTQKFHDHAAALNIQTPEHEPRATDYIKEQIALVKQLEEKGFTYQTADGIYFDTSKFDRYGELAKLDIAGLRGGERVDLADKRNKTDFALWKFSPTDSQRDMEWESPWGKGFPGWHIECSAMSKALLGEHFDIHTGGIDHVPVHHTNEIAQSECAHGAKYVNYWLHNEFLVLNKGEKISKSSGNFITLDTVIEKGIDPLALRYFFLQAHYRQQQDFTWEALEDAQNALHRLWARIERLKVDAKPRSDDASVQFVDDFSAKLFNDFNAPQALAVIWQLLDAKKVPVAAILAALEEIDAMLGLSLMADHSALIKPIPVSELPADVATTLTARDAARADKNWAESDRLRDELIAAGYKVQDTASGTELTLA